MLLFLYQPTRAERIAVTQPEGTTHGFLILRETVSGRQLASGDLVESIHGHQVTVHLLFRFRDGSVDDETTVYSQKGDFQLESDHHIQRGPSFPQPYDLQIDPGSGTVTLKDPVDIHGKDQVYHLDLQPDLANGMIPVLLKNMEHHTGETRLSFLALSPKPRLVTLAVTQGAVETFRAAGRRYRAIRYDIKVELGGLTGIVAPILGKEPRLDHVWITAGAGPAIVRMQAQMYVNGPMWDIELVSPVWH